MSEIQDLEGVASGEEVKLINQGIKSQLPTISLTMIVRNEEGQLPQCLDPIKDVLDEIIIVDTGSTDKTVEIAKKYTDKVFHFEIPKIVYQG
ncbi:MAG: glycosyltransferase, partial [Anaerolineaceae bacterium]